MTYSFSYINEYGWGDVVEVKDFATDQEAMKHGRELLELSIRDVQPQPHASGFQDPCITIDKWENGYPGIEDINDDELIDTAYVVAEYDDGTYNADCTEINYHREIKEQGFEL